MSNLQQRIVIALIEKAKKSGLNPDEQGYLPFAKDNLIYESPCWDQIEVELKNGNGNELKPGLEGGKPKFCALHSSSALCVNTFSIIKENARNFEFQGQRNFESTRFEMKLSTGISQPNLDFFLKNSEVAIGVESKFLENLYLKSPKNLDKYLLRRKEISEIPDDLFKLIRHYRDVEYLGYLDVGQLIKHAIGLIRYSKFEETTPKLIFIYWTPEDDGALPVVFKKLDIELRDFKNRITPFIDFSYMRYEDLWSDIHYIRSAKLHVTKLLAKYQLPSSSLK